MTPTRPRLRAIVETEDVDELVVGLPLEASGAEGPQAALTRAWVAAVADRLGLSGYPSRRALCPATSPRTGSGR